MADSRGSAGDRGSHALCGPETFAAIVPTVLPGSGLLWMFVSGATEIGVAIAVGIAASRRVAATLATVFFALVFPANVTMAVDRRVDPGGRF